MNYPEILSLVVVSTDKQHYDFACTLLRDQDNFAIRSYWQPEVTHPLGGAIEQLSQVDCLMFTCEVISEDLVDSIVSCKPCPAIIVCNTITTADIEYCLSKGIYNLHLFKELTPESLSRIIRSSLALNLKEQQAGGGYRNNAYPAYIDKATAKIAHDLNNVLGAILGHLDLIKISVEQDSDVSKYTDLALTSGERARQLIEQLGTFSSDILVESQVVNLQQLILEISEVLSRILPRNIAVFCKTDRTATYHVKASLPELRQAIIDLATNAQEAMPNGGNLSFSFIGSENIHTPLAKHDTNYVCLVIQDSGNGISDTALTKVFNPEYTTKPDRTSGLGLATVQKIISQHSGWIEITSEEDRGTCVMIYLPLSKKSPDSIYAQNSNSQSKPSHSKLGTVLVLEDEAMLCELIKLYLESAGISSVVFKNPVAAIEWYRTNHADIDLVLLDMVMPELSGSKCFKLLREISMTTPIAICSGSLDKHSQQLLKQGALKFFQKPGRYPLMVTWIAEELNKRTKNTSQ